MKIALKITAVTSNLLGIAAGIMVCLTMLLGLDFYSVLFIPGMTTAESLFFNMIMFVLGLSALMFILTALSEEKKSDVEFPTFFAIIPLAISVVFIIKAFSLSTSREKIIVILSAVIYFLLSSTLLYNGAKIFQKQT